jgi:hypothetical protein
LRNFGDAEIGNDYNTQVLLLAVLKAIFTGTVVVVSETIDADATTIYE